MTDLSRTLQAQFSWTGSGVVAGEDLHYITMDLLHRCGDAGTRTYTVVVTLKRARISKK